MIELSVIIPTMGKSGLLEETLKSINFQTFKNVETIVINNGNNPLVSGAISQYSFCREIIFSSNQGFAKAVNRGIEESKGKYILLLNDDIVINNNRLFELMLDFIENEDYDGLAIKILNNDGKLESCGDCYGRDNRPYGCKKIEYRRVLGPTGGFALYKRELFKDIKFDENFFAYFEDIDLNIRLFYKGYKFFCYPDLSVLHKGSLTAAQGGKYRGYSERKVFWMARNRFYLLVKNWHLLDVISNIHFLIGGFLFSLLFHIKTGYWYVFLSGTLAGITNAYKLEHYKGKKGRIKEVWNLR